MFLEIHGVTVGKKMIYCFPHLSASAHAML